MKNIDFNNIKNTTIFLSEIRINGIIKDNYVSPYTTQCIVNVTDKSLCLYSLDECGGNVKPNIFTTLHFKDILNIVLSIYKREYFINNNEKNYYHIDIHIDMIDKNTYHLELKNWDNFLEMIDLFSKEKVNIDDPINIIERYRNKKSLFIKELDEEFDALANIHNIPKELRKYLNNF